MTDDRKDSASESSPLQRYLARQRSGDSATPNATSNATTTATDQPAAEVESPTRRLFKAKTEAPPAPEAIVAAEPSSRLNSRFTAEDGPVVSTDIRPGGFWARAFAFLLDSIIVKVLSSTVAYALGFGAFMVPQFLFEQPSWYFSQPLVLIVMFFYYGWFYANRGATPGKLLMQLEVVETGSGRRVGYVRTFFRETVGKAISGLLLGIGYLVAAFRTDHKALHDLIFDTRVLVARAPRKILL